MKKEEKKDKALYFENNFDTLAYYAKVAKKLRGFLKGKKIASKIWLPKGIPFFLVRGSKKEPLYMEDFSTINEKMLRLRKKHLGEVRQQLSKKQELVWKYFPPRKLIDLLYATNDEAVGKPIERIFIDIDRQDFFAELAQKVAKLLIEEIKKDKDFNKMLKYKVFIMWTGNSFHVYLLLKKQINLAFYNTYLSYGKKKEKSFLMKWAKNIGKKLGIQVEAGHEKTKNKIILDSSNTPSGKLARAPFSLNIKKNKIVGFAVPLTEKQLSDKALVRKLQSLSAEKVLNNLSSFRI